MTDTDAAAASSSSSPAADIPIADLPSGTPVPSSTPSPSPSKAPAGIDLGALLAAAPRDADAFLAHLHRCMQTPSGIDVVLQFVCYTSRLGSSLLAAAASRHALRHSARRLVALAFALPSRGTILVAAPAAEKGDLAAAEALALAQRLKALSGLLSEARVILRLWSLLGMYFWAKRLVSRLLARPSPRTSSEKAAAAAAPTSLVRSALEWTQLVSCIVFQALENGAYLSSKGIMSWSPAAQGRANLWSCRIWGVYVGTELGRIAFELAHKKGAAQAAQAAQAAEVATLKKALVRNMAWAPLTAHWGSEKGFLSDTMVGLLASVPATIQMRDLWRDTAAVPAS